MCYVGSENIKIWGTRHSLIHTGEGKILFARKASSAMSGSYQTLVEGEAALEDAYDCRDAAEAALDALSVLLRQVEGISNPNEAMAKLTTCHDAVAHARGACREFELEMGGAAGSDPGLQEDHQTCTKRLQQLLRTLDFLRATRQREVLLLSCAAASDGTSASQGGNGVDIDKLSPADLIALGSQVQAESEKSVARMMQMVESSREVGASTMVNLAQQKTKLERVLATTAAQEAQFAMAEGELREFAEEALGDSITQVLFIIVFAGLAFIASWHMSESGAERFEHYGAASSTGSLPNGGWPTKVYSALDLRVE